MNWSDERYVKLYVRNTATWMLWPWQARAVFPLMLRVANGAGIIETGSADPLTALSVLVGMPREVVETAVSSMLETGSIETIKAGFLMPKYLEAQEATKTPAQKKRDQRDRERSKAREFARPPVTESHQVSPAVTDCHQLSPSSPTTNHQPNHQPPTTNHQPSESPPAALSADADLGFGPKDLQALWNALPAPFPKCSVLSEKRKTSAKARIAEVPDRDRWQRAVRRIPSQPFLAGENNRKWVANFDWLVRPDTLVKLEERLSAQSETSIVGTGEITSREAVF